MKRHIAATLLACTLALHSACSKEAAEATPGTTSGAVARVTGIPECDQFLAAYEHCLMDRIPAETRGQLATGIEQWKTAWQAMTDDADARATLPVVCRQARDASAATLRTYGCAL